MQQPAVTEQVHYPVFQRFFTQVQRRIEVRVIPGDAVENGGAGDTADNDRYAGARGLCRLVPRDHACIRDDCSVRKTWSKNRPEPEDRERARIQWSGIVCGER